MRIVPIYPLAENRAYFAQQVGSDAFADWKRFLDAGGVTARFGLPTPGRRSPSCSPARAPAALGVNEFLCRRLELPEAGGRLKRCRSRSSPSALLAGLRCCCWHSTSRGWNASSRATTRGSSPSPARPATGTASGLLPLDLGRRALGVRDDVEHRRVVQRFWLTRPRDTSAPTPARLAARAQVQAELAAAEAKGGPDASQIATLLGVLALLSPPDRVEQAQVLDAAAAAFRRAIALDGTNEDAKHNLESVLRGRPAASRAAAAVYAVARHAGSSAGPR